MNAKDEVKFETLKRCMQELTKVCDSDADFLCVMWAAMMMCVEQVDPELKKRSLEFYAKKCVEMLMEGETQTIKH